MKSVIILGAGGAGSELTFYIENNNDLLAILNHDDDPLQWKWKLVADLKCC